VILGTFSLANQITEIIVRGNELLFHEGGMITSVDGIRFSKAGVLKEFPDLKDNEDWKKQAIIRLKEHIKKMNSEMEAMNYVKDELTKQGYTPLFMQRAGFRPAKWQ
jgi:hypothetical protein